jgi:ABC-type Mn2+/Zn2+ transport system ATPase subunit
VKASQNFVGKSIIDIFREDLINVYNQKVSKIRPVVGANGAGKTTLLKFRVKAY